MGVERIDRHFDYLAGVSVKKGAALPDGFSAPAIRGGHYAVFRITLNGGAVHPQLKGAMAKIWGELVPGAGLKVAEGPDFERYDSEFAPTVKGAVIDFYLPVEV